jgi:protein ImuA
VLAWLPARLPADALRRLQLAAQAHEGPAFVLRGVEASRQASPAPLRLQLSAAAPDWLRVVVLKRRGPALAQPLLLELPPVLAAPASGRARAGSVVPGAVPASVAASLSESWLPLARGTQASLHPPEHPPQLSRGSWA